MVRRSMSWADKVQNFEVGQKVAFKASWLRNTGQYTGAAPFARGIIKALKTSGDTTIATVDWGAARDEVMEKVNVGILSKVTAKGIADE